MFKSLSPLRFALALSMLAAMSSSQAGEGFDVVVLGARGGIQDGNLSAYMIHPHGDPNAVLCDAGSVVNGLRAADEKGAFAAVQVPAGFDLSRAGYVLTHDIKGYLLSHAHLDHVAGLVIAAPDDSRKPIYALASVNQQIVANYFNWQAWPNFTDRGTAPRLGTYALQDLPPGRPVALQGTAMSVSAYPLRHDATESTAFLLESADDAMLCLGDTGPDEVQQSTRLAELWAAVAEKARRHQLKGIVIEVSYDSARADNKLFGHLTPKWLLHELRALERQAGAGALRGMPVIVSHIKYALTSVQPQERIRAELDAGNDLGLRFILPEQGDTLRLP